LELLQPLDVLGREVPLRPAKPITGGPDQPAALDRLRTPESRSRANARKLLRDVLREGTPDLTAEASIAFAGELRHGLRKLRLNPRADVNQVLFDGVVQVHT
jgi:hypothetical protein